MQKLNVNHGCFIHDHHIRFQGILFISFKSGSRKGKGEFSFRGGILDVFPPIAIYPYRVELFGDEVDSIRTFNIESQRSIEKVKSFTIFPAKEVIVSNDIKENSINIIKAELNELIDKSSNKKNEQLDKLQTIVNKNTVNSYQLFQRY